MSDLVHVPVMLPDVISAMDPSPGERFVDATYGGGGYTRALVDLGVELLSIDRDPFCVSRGRSVDYGDSATIIEGEFSSIELLVHSHGWDSVDGIVADLGVSSFQLDDSSRGFSFSSGPLDMRMSQEGVSASDVVNRASCSDLTRIIRILGEERYAYSIASLICERRASRPFQTGPELALLIEGIVRGRKDLKIHPATRTFMALRMYVNNELTELASLLLASEELLRPGGRLCVVSFHSLEDRITKRFFRRRSEHSPGSRHFPSQSSPPPTFEVPHRSILTPSPSEISSNPRSRSAKLRYGIRTSSPALEGSIDEFGLPVLPPVSRYAREAA